MSAAAHKRFRVSRQLCCVGMRWTVSLGVQFGTMWIGHNTIYAELWLDITIVRAAAADADRFH